MNLRKKKNVLLVTTFPDILERLSKFTSLSFMQECEFFIVAECFGSNSEVKVSSNYFTIDDLRNTKRIEECLILLRTLERFDLAISTDEYSVLTAAYFRQELNIPGLKPMDVIKFRDKVEMKYALNGSDIKFPKFYTIREIENTTHLNFPLVAKPRSYAGSHGIQILENQNELNSLLNRLNKETDNNYISGGNFSEFSLLDYEFEEYISGEIYHLDGLVKNKEILFFQPSKYIGKCIEFLNEKPLGSIFVTDKNECKAWFEFTEKINQRLNIPDGAFHLEAFLTPKGERVFLEIGIRPGGALIIPTIFHTWGIHLEELHLALQFGENIKIPTKPIIPFGGYCVFPKKYMIKEKVTIKSTNIEEFKNIQTLVWKKIPDEGYVANNIFISYIDNFGSFIFAGFNIESVGLDLNNILNNYKVIIQSKEGMES